MQPLVLLAVLTALAVTDAAGNSPVDAAAWRFASVLGIIGGLGLVAVGVSRQTARELYRNFDARRLVLIRFAWLRRAHHALWLAAISVILCNLSWPQLVRGNWGLERAFLLDEVLILAPVLLPLIVAWGAFYDVDRAVRRGQSKDNSAVRIWSRGEYLSFHIRHYLGLLLVLLLGLLALGDGLDRVGSRLLESPNGWMAFAPPIALLCLFFPAILRFVWGAEPLADGALRRRLELTARRAGFQATDILVWRTGGSLVNAAVAGIVPQLRYVFLSDALLARMSDAEVEAVFAHEIGHIRHHHLLLRAMAVVAPVAVWLAMNGLASGASAGATVNAGSYVASAANMSTALSIVALGAYLLIVFGFYSRRLEEQADLFGCQTVSGLVTLASSDQGEESRLARSYHGITDAGIAIYVAALEKLASLNGQRRQSGSWEHSSVAARVEFLQHMRNKPAQAAIFHRRLRLAAGLVVGLVVGGLGAPLFWQFFSVGAF